MMRGQVEQTKIKKDMSSKINEIVQQKARESVGTLKNRNPFPPPLQMIDRGFAFRGSDEAKRNIMWVNTTYQNQNYFNDSVSSVHNKAKNLSRIKAAQARLVQNSAQNAYSSKQDSNNNNLKDQDTLSFFRSQSRNSSQNRIEHRYQTGQVFQSHKTSKPLQVQSAMKLGEGQYNNYTNGYGNYDNQSNGRSSRRNNDNETSWEESNEESRQTQLREQVLIQEGRILQLEELLKRETLNSEEQRSQVRYLKTELLKSVSNSGLADLFEEAYISSLDKQVDIIVQLKAIQQKIEEDVQDNESVMQNQDENVQQLMEQNQIMQMQANQCMQLHEEVSNQFQIVVEEKRVIEDEKYQLEEANLKLIEEIEKAVQKNQRLAEENQRFLKENERLSRDNIMKNRQIEERMQNFQELEILLKDTNEEKIEQERAIEDGQQTIIKLEEQSEIMIKEFEILINSKNQDITVLNEERSKQKEEILKQTKEITKQIEYNNQLKGQFESQRNILASQASQIDNQQRRIEELEQENERLKEKDKSNEIAKDREVIGIQGIKNEDQVTKSEFESIQSRLNQEIKKFEEIFKQFKNAEDEILILTKEIEKLKDQNQHYLDTNTQLQQLVEQNQLLLSQANQEQIQKQKLDGTNRLVQQNHELRAQINSIRSHDASTIDELKQRVEFMQQKSHFFSNQVIEMAKKLNILDNQDDAVSQEEYESLVLEISSKIDSLIEEKQSDNENINQEQLEEELVEQQHQLANLVQEKYILETEIEQLRGFITNNQVFEVIDKYSECMCQLFDNEAQYKELNDALVECNELDEEHDQQGQQEEYIERLKQELAENIEQHQRIEAQRDYYHSQIQKLQEEEMEKYKIDEYNGDIQQENISDHSKQGEQNDDINQKFDDMNGKYAINGDNYGTSNNTDGEQEEQEDGRNEDEFQFHQVEDFEDQDEEQNQYDHSKYSEEGVEIEENNDLKQ